MTAVEILLLLILLVLLADFFLRLLGRESFVPVALGVVTVVGIVVGSAFVLAFYGLVITWVFMLGSYFYEAVSQDPAFWGVVALFVLLFGGAYRLRRWLDLRRSRRVCR